MINIYLKRYRDIEQTINNLATKILVEDTPIDTIMSEGYYTVFYTSGNFSGYNIIHVRKFAGNATYLEQLLINLDNEKISSRVCRGGTWRNWHTITYNADLIAKVRPNIGAIDYDWDNNNPKLIVTDANGAIFYASLTRR